METIYKRFEELDICSKVSLNSMCPPLENVKTKGAQKKPMAKHQRSTKCNYLSMLFTPRYYLFYGSEI